LRAAGAREVDPTLDEVRVDEDGTIRGKLPTPGTVASTQAGPEGGPVVDEPADMPSKAQEDWLSDDAAPTPESPATGESAQPGPGDRQGPAQPEGHLEPSELTDWLSDGDETLAPDPVQPDAQPAEPAIDAPESEDDEDFNGLYTPAPDTEPQAAH